MATSITRRSAIGAIAALSATGGATVASPASAVPDDDVSAISALTEVHTAAMQAFSACCDPFEESGRELDRLNRADRILVKVSPTKSFELGACEMPEEIERQYAERRKALDVMAKAWSPKLRSAALRQLRREKADSYKSLAEAEAKLAARKEACGYAHTERRWSSASDAEQQAFWEILTYRCRNRAQLGVKATYLMHAIGKLRGTILDEQEVDALIWSMLPDDDRRVIDAA